MKKKASSVEEHKEFKNKVFSVLKTMKIVPKGYFPYPEFSELVGSQEPEWPYTMPLRVMVQLSFRKITKEMVHSFNKSSRDTKAVRSLIFGIEESARLNAESRSNMKAFQIEYFGPSDVSKLLSDKGVSLSNEEVQEYKKASEVVHPILLVNGLPELALKMIPSDIQKSLNALNLRIPPAWELLEEAVFSSFSYCLGYNVRQLGKESRFETEPEGVVAVRFPSSFGILYECKSAKDAYKMTVDHKRAYVEYILQKKAEVLALDKVELRYFVLVGPKFEGDEDNRRNQVYQETGVLVVFLKADVLMKIAKWASEITDSELKRLISVGEIFTSIQDIEVQDKTVNEYIKKFDEKNRKRY